MDKLALSDIKIKSPGKQIKEKIIDEFGDISNFAKKINMDTNTVKQYLKETKVGSETFKIRLCRIFDKGINELVKSEKEQIKDMVHTIYL